MARFGTRFTIADGCAKKQSNVEDGIDHKSEVILSLTDLMDDDDTSDVTFIVDDGQKIKGHRIIFASRSQYFRALLFNGLKESEQKEITLKEVSGSSFKILKKYLYTGVINATDVQNEFMSLLYLSDCYCLTHLYQSLLNYVKQNLCPDLALKAYELSSCFQNDDLRITSMSYILQNVEEVLMHKSFEDAPYEIVSATLKSDYLVLPEVRIYDVLVKYMRTNNHSSESLKTAIREIVRFPLLKEKDIEHIHEDGTFSIEELLEIQRLRHTATPESIKYRYLFNKDTNYAVNCYGFEVMKGKPKLQLDVAFLELCGNRFNERKSVNESVIEITLGKRCLANFIRIIAYIEPYKRETRSLKKNEERCSKRQKQVISGYDFSYTYDIYVSPCKNSWKKVTGSNAFSHLWQYVYFESQVVKYIRIVVRDVKEVFVTAMFHLLYFECCYSTDNFTFDDQSNLIPHFNVLSFPKVPSFYPGSIPNEFFCMFNARTQKQLYELYSYHEIDGSSHFLFTLSQDSLIDTIEFCLYDRDSRKYDYVVYIGRKYENMEKVKKCCNASSLQQLSFKPTVVRYIKLQGLAIQSSSSNHFVVININVYKKYE